MTDHKWWLAWFLAAFSSTFDGYSDWRKITLLFISVGIVTFGRILDRIRANEQAEVECD